MGSKILAPFLTTATNSNIEKNVSLDNLTVATVIPNVITNFKSNCCQWYLLIKKI